ncbi:MAG: GNAT family N-acetyltransferase [Oscillospiraceae bacterium]|nr:GNAT family N-acetyltransferase [Eubacteriales bacterium]MDY2618072.1 GNAT family N-acetyltransferase [Oscillospiraceae bacterium]
MNELACLKAVIDADPIRYLDLTQPLARGTGQVVDADAQGALVRVALAGGGDHYTLSAQTEQRAAELIALLPEDPGYVTWHEELCWPLLQKRFGYPGCNFCWQTAYMSASPIPVPEHSFTLRALDESFYPAVRAQYTLIGDDDLMKTLQRHDVIGAFNGDTLAGFMGWHDDGTLGLLEVYPAYRRRGLASLLEAHIVNLDLSRGFIPYAQIFEDNLPSLALQTSLGCQRSRGPVYWPKS